MKLPESTKSRKRQRSESGDNPIQELDVQVCPCLKPKNLMPCPFTGPKMFCDGPNFLSQPKNLTAFSASSKPYVPAQKPILLNANHLFAWHKIFVTSTIC